ncbi:hypothetical protein N566_24305 [Streptomycetaceae bacterium MP113-05]|nr:hypothetical protein N566_24305 [Streptomycetaceae bacterium MP113-05]
MLVDEVVAKALREQGVGTVRVYVAAITERMAPLFVGLQAVAGDRNADLDLYIASAHDLWLTDRPSPDVPERQRALGGFPELQPRDEGISDIVGTYSFFAVLVLRYALLANRSGSAEHAIDCGHAALTSMGMLDQNLADGPFLGQEQHLQLRSVSGDASELWEASFEAGRERFRAVLGRARAVSG